MTSKLHLCSTYPELKSQLDILTDIEKRESAKILADSIVASDLFNDGPYSWIVRQLLKYIDPEKRDAFISYILTNTDSATTVENIDMWLGKPFDGEGAIILMEAMYNTKGWEWIISARQSYSLNQRVRMFHKLQTSNAEDIFISLLEEKKLNAIQKRTPTNIGDIVYNTRAMEIWRSPDTWPNLNSLTDDKKYVLWCMYAKQNNMELLLKLAKAFEWNTWVSEQTFLPNTKHYAFKYKDRLDYIKTFISNVKTITKNSKVAVEMPEFDFSMS